MGFFDKFKRKHNNNNNNNNSPEREIQSLKEDLETQNGLIDSVLQVTSSYSNAIPKEIIEKIIKVNNLDYISDVLLQRMEKYPELVDLLLKGNISSDTLFLLNYDKVFSLPNKEDLQFIKFLDFDEKNEKLVGLLNNMINIDSINNDYISCYADLSKESETVVLDNVVNSFVPNVEINLGSELLTEMPCYSSFILFFPKSKYKIVYRDFEQFITGNIELNEDIIVQMSYDTFRYLDEVVINKISKCKIVFSEDSLDYSIKEGMSSEEEINYKLIKYNHLIYIIDNSSLNSEIKKRLVYQLKNMYTDETMMFDLEVSDKIFTYLNDLSIEEIKKLTEEFELNIDVYRTKIIEKPEFNVNYYIDEMFPDFDNMPLQKIIYHINQVPQELRITVIKEPRILKKLDLPSNLSKEELERVSFLLSQSLTRTTLDFIHSLNFDVQAFMSNKDNNYQTSYDINPIISNYGVFDYADEKIEISIEDLLGHDAYVNCGGYKGKNILHTFENFFEKDSDTYHTRALGLLEYKTGEELLESLEKTQDTLDMKVRQVENGKYVISSNGLHRFTVLRFHYLLDCMKKEKSKEDLRELYRIPVNLVSTTNFKKTYCNYLVQKANLDISSILFDHRQDEITVFYDFGGKSEKINEEKLLFLAIQSIELLDSKSLLEIITFYNNCISFRNFIDEYIPNLLTKIETEDREMIQK